MTEYTIIYDFPSFTLTTPILLVANTLQYTHMHTQLPSRPRHYVMSLLIARMFIFRRRCELLFIVLYQSSCVCSSDCAGLGYRSALTPVYIWRHNTRVTLCPSRLLSLSLSQLAYAVPPVCERRIFSACFQLTQNKSHSGAQEHKDTRAPELLLGLAC